MSKIGDTPRTDAVFHVIYAALSEMKHRGGALSEGVSFALTRLHEHSITLERENAALQSDIERHVKIASDLATENAAYLAQIARLDSDLNLLREQLAEARANEARYLWLCNSGKYCPSMIEGWALSMSVSKASKSDLDEAIDKARAKESGNG